MKLPEGIRQRGDSLLVDITIHGVRKTGTVKGANNVAEALALRESLKASLICTIAGDAPLSSSTWTLQQAFDMKCQLHWNQKESKSWRKLRQNGEFILRHFGPATNIASLTTDKLDALGLELDKQGLSGATINRKMSAASALLSLAVDKDKLAKRPQIERKSEGPGRKRFFTEAEEGLILGTFRQFGMTEQAEIAMILIDTGLRASELARLEAHHCNFAQTILYVMVSKNAVSRAVPMTARVRALLQARAETRLGILYQFTADKYDKDWNRVREHLGMMEDTDFVPYTLRHTFGSRLAQRGVPLDVIKDLMGHKSIVTTLRYRHLCPKNYADAVAVLETNLPS